jgi:hypothetical protein
MESDQTRIVWITILAIADKNGEVQASIPGLARIAGVSIEACETAINKFLSPDPYSRTPDDEGRRIEKIEGGWSILNHAKYRELASRDESKSSAAERQKRFRERQRRNASVTDSNTKPLLNNATVTQDMHIAEADTEADTDTEVQNTPLPPKGETKGPLQLRASAIFRRKPETPFTSSESRAFKKNIAAIKATTEEEWQTLEAFYKASQSETYSRKDLATLVNNWNGEIDRAKAWHSRQTEPQTTKKTNGYGPKGLAPIR